MSSPEHTSSSPEHTSGPRLPVDLVGGLTLLAVVAVFLLKAGEGYLDWLFPLVLSYAVGALAVILAVRGLLGRGKRMPVVPAIIRGRGVDVAVFIALALAYVILAEPVGFWITSVAMIFIGSTYLSVVRDRRTLAVSLAVALSVGIIAFFLLTRVFYVPLPQSGWLPF